MDNVSQMSTTCASIVTAVSTKKGHKLTDNRCHLEVWHQMSICNNSNWDLVKFGLSWIQSRSGAVSVRYKELRLSVLLIFWENNQFTIEFWGTSLKHAVYLEKLKWTCYLRLHLVIPDIPLWVRKKYMVLTGINQLKMVKFKISYACHWFNSWRTWRQYFV